MTLYGVACVTAYVVFLVGMYKAQRELDHSENPSLKSLGLVAAGLGVLTLAVVLGRL